MPRPLSSFDLTDNDQAQLDSDRRVDRDNNREPHPLVCLKRYSPPNPDRAERIRMAIGAAFTGDPLLESEGLDSGESA